VRLDHLLSRASANAQVLTLIGCQVWVCSSVG
jgi:hypothetical protein